MQAIIIQSFIAAPVPQVWDALERRTDVLFDGLPAGAWPEGPSQPPFQRSAPWPFTAAAGGDTSVELVLHDLGTGTRVDVRHQGWGEGPAWDHAIQGHFAGWLQGLAALGLLLEAGVDARPAGGPAGAARYFISGEVPAPSSPVYRALIDPAVRARWDAAGALDGARLTQYVDDKFARWSAGAAEVTAILRATPRGTHVALAEYGIAGEGASGRWPAMFEALARFLA